MIALLVAVALAQPAAQPKKTGWVALVHTEGNVPATWREPLQRAAEDYKQPGWVPPPAVTIDEASLALGCAGFNDACAGQIASMTGATHAFVIEVTSSAGEGTLSVSLVRANGKSERERVVVDVPDLGADGLSWAKEVVRAAAAGTALPAMIVVETNLAADVSVDDLPVGKTTPHTPVRAIVQQGAHRVRLAGAGDPVERTVEAVAGQIVRESVQLAGARDGVKEVTTAPEQPPEVATSSAAVVGWSLTGAGAAVIAVGGSLAGAALFDFFNREKCGVRGERECVPVRMLLGYQGPDRERFFNSDFSVWMGATGAAVGVGALLLTTGMLVALSEE